MNEVKINNLKDKLNALEGFIENKEAIKSSKIIKEIRKIFKRDPDQKIFIESEILEWVAESVVIFTELSVNDVVVENFLDFSKLKIEYKENETEKRIGPFVTVGSMSKEYWLSNIIDFNHVKIAFSCARKNLEKIENDIRLIPKYLSNSFKNDENYKQIGYILESLEDSYVNKDVGGIISKSFNLVEEILNIDEDFKKSKAGVKDKLGILIKNPSKREKFGVDIQVLDALNNFRVIRNKKVVHNSLPIKSNIPMISAISIASLAILFLEVVFANKKIKYD